MFFNEIGQGCFYVIFFISLPLIQDPLTFIKKLMHFREGVKCQYRQKWSQKGLNWVSMAVLYQDNDDVGLFLKITHLSPFQEHILGINTTYTFKTSKMQWLYLFYIVFKFDYKIFILRSMKQCYQNYELPIYLCTVLKNARAYNIVMRILLEGRRRRF